MQVEQVTRMLAALTLCAAVFALGFVAGRRLPPDEGEAAFVRKPDASLCDPKTLSRYTGKYVLAGGTVEVLLIDGALYLAAPGSPKLLLDPWKPGRFRVKQFSDLVIEFVEESGSVVAMKQADPSGEYRFERKR